MKSILGILLVLVSFSAMAERDFALEREVSAVLTSELYQTHINELKEASETSGQTLVISHVFVGQSGDGTMVNIQLAQERNAEVQAPAEPLGSLVAMISYGPLGGIIIDALFFKPIATPPSTVGVTN